MGDSKGTEDLEKQLSELKEWVAKQPQLPKNMEDKLLRRFLHSCYYDMGKAQKAVEAFSSLRANVPELFADRDPQSPREQNALKYANVAQLRISGNRNLWIFQLNDPGLKNFNHVELVRNYMISVDAWFLEEENLEESTISIMDGKDISWKVFWKINMSVLRNSLKYQEEALPVRIKQMHMVNASPVMEKLFSIMKQFMSKELSELVHLHVPNSETLFQFISKDDLPRDLGGNLDSLEYYNKKTIDLVDKHGDTLMRNDLWKTPEKKSTEL